MSEAFICKDSHYEILSSTVQTVVCQLKLTNLTIQVSAGQTGRLVDSKSDSYQFSMPVEYFEIENATETNFSTEQWGVATTPLVGRVVSTSFEDMLIHQYNNMYYPANNAYYTGGRRIWFGYDGTSTLTFRGVSYADISGSPTGGFICTSFGYGDVILDLKLSVKYL